MKRIVLACALLSAFVAGADIAISQVTVSQARPWKTDVTITYTVADTDGSTWKMTFTAYDGARRLGVIPETALAGDSYADTDGTKQVSFDPAAVDFLKREGAVADLRVGVSAENVGNILYKVIDLRYAPGTSYQTVYVTEADLNAGTKTVGIPGSTGTVTWDLSCVTNPVNGIASLVWIGLTNRVSSMRFMNSHLVMRRVKGGSFTLRPNNAAIAKSATVGDFWIAVFPCTISHIDWWCTPVGERPQYEGQLTVRRENTYGWIRGTENVWPEDGDTVTGTNFIAKLRAKTGIATFDIPTEAQWEYACRAGTSTTYYNNTDDASTLGEIARYNGNTDANPLLYAGTCRPNAWGLFDMIGGVWEFVRDWNCTNPTAVAQLDSGWEPAGSPSFCCSQRTVRGGCFLSGAGNCTNFSRTSDDKTRPEPTEIGSIYGFRVMHTGW